MGISSAVVAAGMFLPLPTEQAGYQSILLDDLHNTLKYQSRPPEYPNSMNDIITGSVAFKPYALIALGLVILIAIQVLCVAVSAWALSQE